MVLAATHGAADRPLRIGDIEIPCYVLEGGKRVLHQRGLVSALGMARGGSSRGGGDRLAHFVTQKTLEPFVSNQLVEVTATPLLFRTPRGALAYGYEATVLADICEAILEARKSGALQKQQLHLAEKAEILVRGFARVGIIALVDEATGYQQERDRDELHKLLEVYLSAERLKWAKRFPDEFYRQIYRLLKWPWPPVGTKRSPYLGQLTNKLVYDKLPEGVLAELKNRNPTIEGTKRRRWKHHQFLSEDIGQPDLRDHILQTVAILRGARTWEDFEDAFERAFPGPQARLF